MRSFALFSVALIQTVSGLAIKERQADASLDELIKAKGKEYFGTCADPGTLGNQQNAAIIQADFGQVTPENSMKWGSLEGASKEIWSSHGFFTYELTVLACSQ